jgi:hypothetical protein
VPRWQLNFCFDGYYIEIISKDPLRGRVSVPCEDETLQLKLDTAGTVVEI